MSLEPVEIQHVKLRRRFFLFGYRRDEVDRLLEDVTSSYEEVWLERDGLRDENARLKEEVERYRERERLVGDVLLSAHRIAESQVAEAKSAAETLMIEARKKADELVSEAQREPERLREEIRRLRGIEDALHERLRSFVSGAQELLDVPEGEALLGTLRLPERGVPESAPSAAG